MNFHPEILSTRQRRVLDRLGPFLTARQCYLAGGTALALQLGHRRSVDFDWFTEDPLEVPLGLAEELRDGGIPFITTDASPGTLYGTVSGTPVSVIHLGYPLLKRAVVWRELGCRLAALP